MKNSNPISLARFWAVVVKEFIQMRRDKVTFAMMLGVPVIQLLLFGFAINSDPKHLPAAILLGDPGPMGRAVLHAMHNSGYFEFTRRINTEKEGDVALARGDVQFVINIPADFSRKLLRGEHPAVLVDADATDPAATSNALGSLDGLINTALANDLKGPLDYLNGASGPIDLRIHAKYNPERITQYNIVPGLMGVALTMTMIMITSLAITREEERGTMENLLSMPTRPVEVMMGKIIPYILVGYIQAGLIMLAAHYLFHVPMAGSIPLLLAMTLIFIAANLCMGITYSTLASNQLQAVQMGFFFFLPSILLSGFMFPFRGMPGWAQWLGEMLPLTHYLRIVRGILLKGNGFWDIAPEIWPMTLFTILSITVAVKRYRQTLD